MESGYYMNGDKKTKLEKGAFRNDDHDGSLTRMK